MLDGLKYSEVIGGLAIAGGASAALSGIVMARRVRHNFSRRPSGAEAVLPNFSLDEDARDLSRQASAAGRAIVEDVQGRGPVGSWSSVSTEKLTSFISQVLQIHESYLLPEASMARFCR